MSQKLVFMRHGQSVWNLENLFSGWTDADLSEKGEQMFVILLSVLLP